MNTGFLSWGKAVGSWLRKHAPSSVEVKESVQLYLYSPSGISWLVLGELYLYLYLYLTGPTV